MSSFLPLTKERDIKISEEIEGRVVDGQILYWGTKSMVVAKRWIPLDMPLPFPIVDGKIKFRIRRGTRTTMGGTYLQGGYFQEVVISRPRYVKIY